MTSLTDRKNRLPYSIAFYLPPEILGLMAIFRRKLADCCREFEPLESAHLTVKYLGFPVKDFSEAELLANLPRLAEIARPLLPLPIALRDLGTFREAPPCEPLVFLKVLSAEPLRELHERLREGLRHLAESFPHGDGANFKPHITLSKRLIPQSLRLLERIIFRSRKASKRRFLLNRLVLMTPAVVYPIIPID
jgi:2'-5' RNA ligase